MNLGEERHDGPVEGELVDAASVGELNRHTSDVIRQVEAGERLVITNHGRPVAALLPIPDGIDVLLAHLAIGVSACASDAKRVLAVELTAKAAQELEELQRSRQTMLMTALRRAAVHSDSEGPLVVRTPQDLAGCVALVDRSVLLVYAVCSRQEAMRRLLGSPLFDVWHARNSARLSHGRPAVRY